MLQSITWLILRKLKKKTKKIILIRKKNISLKESTGGCGGGSDCSASRVLSYYITRRATKEDLQLKKHITTETVRVRYTPRYHEQ